MKTKIEIKSIFGEVLFSFEKENNTIKDTLEEAVKQNANLENANLPNAYLKNANLKNANLPNANLPNANLYNANLENAYLYNANLYNANLENANLKNANLPIFCRWSVNYSNDFKIIYIGCKQMTIEQWDEWFKGNEEFSTRRNTENFKRIKANYEAVKAYCLTMLS